MNKNDERLLKDALELLKTATRDTSVACVHFDIVIREVECNNSLQNQLTDIRGELWNAKEGLKAIIERIKIIK